MNVSGAASGTNTDAAQRAAAMAALDGADRQWPDPRAATGVMPVSNEAYFHPQYATLMREQFGIGPGVSMVSFSDSVAGTAQQPIDLELAQLAQDVYDVNGQGIDGWSRLDGDALRAAGIDPSTLEDSDSGLRAAIYQNDEGETVLAFAGSNDGPDWLNNLQQGIGMDAEQYDQATALARRAAVAFGDELVIVGHSLGGGLASAASLATGNSAVTFNAAGLSDNTIEDLGLVPDAARETAEAGQIRRYNIEGEILTWEQEDAFGDSWILPDALGHEVEMADPDPLGGLSRLWPPNVIGHRIELHSMGSVLDAMRAG